MFVPVDCSMWAVYENRNLPLECFINVKRKAKPTITSVRLGSFGWGNPNFLVCDQFASVTCWDEA